MGFSFIQDKETPGGEGEPDPHLMNVRKWARSQDVTVPETWRGTPQDSTHFKWEYTHYWKPGRQEWQSGVDQMSMVRGEGEQNLHHRVTTEVLPRRGGFQTKKKKKKGGRRGLQKDEGVKNCALWNIVIHSQLMYLATITDKVVHWDYNGEQNGLQLCPQEAYSLWDGLTLFK